MDLMPWSISILAELQKGIAATCSERWRRLAAVLCVVICCCCQRWCGVSIVSLENVAADILELQKGIAATGSELEAARGCRASVSVLEDFLSTAEQQMDMLNTDCKQAQVRVC